MPRFCRFFIAAAAAVAPALCGAGSRPDIENGKTTFNNTVVAYLATLTKPK